MKLKCFFAIANNRALCAKKECDFKLKMTIEEKKYYERQTKLVERTLVFNCQHSN